MAGCLESARCAAERGARRAHVVDEHAGPRSASGPTEGARRILESLSLAEGRLRIRRSVSTEEGELEGHIEGGGDASGDER